MICPYCNKTIPGNSQFCIYCGTRMSLAEIIHHHEDDDEDDYAMDSHDEYVFVDDDFDEDFMDDYDTYDDSFEDYEDEGWGDEGDY